jgi:hypothetical protein
MVKIIVSKNGYFYKIVNNKKIRISKEEYLKKNKKNMKGGYPKTKITVIFVGAAEIIKTNGSRNNKSGQIPNLMEYITMNPENTLIAVDPQHRNNEIPHLSERSGIPVSIMENPNDVKPGCLNISGMDSQTFFDRFTPEELTYYVIFAFYGGIQKEMPSFYVAQSIGIENNFFYYISNALCLGMSCYNIPPNITNFLRNYGFKLNPVFIPVIDQSLEYDFYAIQSDLRALYKVIKKENGISRSPKEIIDILNSLKQINIYSIRDACRYYEYLKRKYDVKVKDVHDNKVKDVHDNKIKDAIYMKYQEMDLNQFFRIRNSNS